MMNPYQPGPIARGGIRLPGAGGPGGAPAPPRRLQRLLGQQRFGVSQFAGGYLPSLIQNFAAQANQDRFSGEGRDAFLAPRLTAIDDAQNAAAGHLTQDLQARGLGDSSAMATGLGGLASAGATARSGALSGLYDAEQERQQGAQGRLVGLLAQAMGWGNQGADILSNLRNQDLQQQEYDDSQKFDIGGFLSGLGGAAGSLFGGGASGSLASLLGFGRKRPSTSPYLPTNDLPYPGP